MEILKVGSYICTLEPVKGNALSSGSVAAVKG